MPLGEMTRMNGVKSCAQAQPLCAQCVYMCVCVRKCVFSREVQFDLLGAGSMCVSGKVTGRGHRPECVRARLGVGWPRQEQSNHSC